ncbi:MAG: acyl-CoA dehydrogenase family protein [Burkholderiaceae bacterium]|nr:acyl-CoA dehydrogenase family protein [Burkholderiaceae bacterium]
MAAIYEDHHEEFRVQVRRFVEREVAPHHPEWEKQGIVPRDVWRKAGDAGLLCCSVPEEYGGPGGDFVHEAIVVQELMRVNATGPGFPVHSMVVAPYISKFGTEKQKKKWLPKMASGELIAAIAMTEPNAGSDLKAITTSAVLKDSTYLINGQKTFISNGINSDLIVTACKTDKQKGVKGISLIAIESTVEGLTKSKPLNKIGFSAQDTSELSMQNIIVPKENLIGNEDGGFFHMMDNLPQERLLIAIRAVAVLEAMLDETITYAKDRRAFGQALFDFQNTKFLLAHVKAQTEMLKIMVAHYISVHMSGKISSVEAAIVKLNATEKVTALLDELLQVFGGNGFMADYLIGKAWVDSRVYSIFGGTNEIMKEIIARDI